MYYLMVLKLFWSLIIYILVVIVVVQFYNLFSWRIIAIDVISVYIRMYYIIYMKKIVFHYPFVPDVILYKIIYFYSTPVGERHSTTPLL